jgi:hypothetical protein
MLTAGIFAVTLAGCRIEERALGEYESYQRWPSPHELASAVDGSYRGKVTWNDTDVRRPPRRIEVRVEIDTKSVRLRSGVFSARTTDMAKRRSQPKCGRRKRRARST